MTNPIASGLASLRSFAHERLRAASATQVTKGWRTRLLLIAVTVCAGFAAGRLHGWSERREVHTQLRVALSEHQLALANTEHRQVQALTREEARRSAERSRIAALSRLAALYDGLRHAHWALHALLAHQRELAESHLRDAELTLAPIAEEVHGLTPWLQKLGDTSVAHVAASESGAETIMSMLRTLDSFIERERAATTSLALAPEAGDLGTAPPLHSAGEGELAGRTQDAVVTVFDGR